MNVSVVPDPRRVAICAASPSEPAGTWLTRQAVALFQMLWMSVNTPLEMSPAIASTAAEKLLAYCSDWAVDETLNCGSGQCATPTRLRSTSESGRLHEEDVPPPALGWVVAKRLRRHCPDEAGEGGADEVPCSEAGSHGAAVLPAVDGSPLSDLRRDRHDSDLGGVENAVLPDVAGKLGA